MKTWMAAVAVLAIAPAPTAEARGPEKSPFAGTYLAGSWPITISDNGQIRASFDEGSTKTTLSGRVDADGRYSYTVEVAMLNPEWGPRDKRKWLRSTSESAGSLALNSDGNLVVTPDSGSSVVWLRQ